MTNVKKKVLGQDLAKAKIEVETGEVIVALVKPNSFNFAKGSLVIKDSSCMIYKVKEIDLVSDRVVVTCAMVDLRPITFSNDQFEQVFLVPIFQ